MRRFGVQYAATISTTAAQATNALGFVTGNGRMCAIYELIVGQPAVVNDATIRVDIYGVSGAITAGGALTPTPLEAGNSAPAANTAVSSAPTGVTTTGLSLLPLVFNSRATVRWAAVDPDSRIAVPAGGGAAGTLVVQNQQPGTVAGLQTLTHLYFVE